VTLAPRGNATYVFSRPRRVAVSLKLPNVTAPKRELGDIVATILLYAQKLMDAPMRTKLQWFLSNTPLSLFKKLLVSTPLLQQGLHTMSLAKAVPDGLKDRECKRSVLCKCPPVSYVPEKDPVQEMASALKDQHLKTHIGEDKTLHLSIWHNGTQDTLLMCVGSTLMGSRNMDISRTMTKPRSST
jgi:hypothetical protein